MSSNNAVNIRLAAHDVLGEQIGQGLRAPPPDRLLRARPSGHALACAQGLREDGALGLVGGRCHVSCHTCLYSTPGRSSMPSDMILRSAASFWRGQATGVLLTACWPIGKNSSRSFLDSSPGGMRMHSRMRA